MSVIKKTNMKTSLRILLIGTMLASCGSVHKAESSSSVKKETDTSKTIDTSAAHKSDSLGITKENFTYYRETTELDYGVQPATGTVKKDTGTAVKPKDSLANNQVTSDPPLLKKITTKEWGVQSKKQTSNVKKVDTTAKKEDDHLQIKVEVKDDHKQKDKTSYGLLIWWLLFAGLLAVAVIYRKKWWPPVKLFLFG